MIRYARHIAELMDRAGWFSRSIQLMFTALLCALALLVAVTITYWLARTLAWLLGGLAA